MRWHANMQSVINCASSQVPLLFPPCTGLGQIRALDSMIKKLKQNRLNCQVAIDEDEEVRLPSHASIHPACGWSLCTCVA